MFSELINTQKFIYADIDSNQLTTPSVWTENNIMIYHDIPKNEHTYSINHNNKPILIKSWRLNVNNSHSELTFKHDDISPRRRPSPSPQLRESSGSLVTVE